MCWLEQQLVEAFLVKKMNPRINKDTCVSGSRIIPLKDEV